MTTEWLESGVGDNASAQQGHSLSSQSELRVPGIDEGKVWFAPDFEDPLPEEVLAVFEGVRDRDDWESD